MGSKALNLWKKVLNFNDLALLATFTSLVLWVGGMATYIFVIHEDRGDTQSEIHDLSDRVTALQDQLTEVSIKEEEHNREQVEKIDALTAMIYSLKSHQ
jgi:hypothetical protein